LRSYCEFNIGHLLGAALHLGKALLNLTLQTSHRRRAHRDERLRGIG
jgi:hypothetical protein